MTERMIEANGVELCTEPFGDPTDAAILLVMGLGGSMLWWDDGFCRMLADAGRFVLRYDHRDTGRSVTYEPGRPGYSADDMVADAVGVLDSYGVGAAHVVGVSAGGALAQLLALDFPDRVKSLVLISTSPATPADRGLPSPTEAFARFVATAQVNWSDSESVIEYLVDYSRMLAGDRRPFDESAHHALVRRDVERAHNIAALQNHDVGRGRPRRRSSRLGHHRGRSCRAHRLNTLMRTRASRRLARAAPAVWGTPSVLDHVPADATRTWTRRGAAGDLRSPPRAVLPGPFHARCVGPRGSRQWLETSIARLRQTDPTQMPPSSRTRRRLAGCDEPTVER